MTAEAPREPEVEPTFSLISLAYKTEPYVAEMIESVRAQTSPDWELIVVDNGMSDAIAGIVDSYSADPRIRLVRQENRGMSGGMAAGRAVARGRYMAVLHSDDQIMPDFCARMGSIIAERPDIDAVGCDAYLFSSVDGELLRRTYRRNGWMKSPRGEKHHRVTLAELISCRQPYYTGAVRRQAWDAVGAYNSGMPRLEDLSLWVRLVQSGLTVWFTPEPLGRYRICEESLSRGHDISPSFEGTKRLLSEAADRSGAAEDLAARASMLKKVGYLHSLHRARCAFLSDDMAAARASAAEAFAHRRTFRSFLVLAGVRLAPALLRLVHPAKQGLARWITQLWRNILTRFSWRSGPRRVAR